MALRFFCNSRSSGCYDSYKVVIAKYFRSKRFDTRRRLPCIEGQSGFTTGLLEESNAVPTVLHGNLGKEQAALRTASDQQSMPADFDFLGKNGVHTREHTQRQLQFLQLGQGDGREPRVFKSGGSGSLDNGQVQRTDR